MLLFVSTLAACSSVPPAISQGSSIAGQVSDTAGQVTNASQATANTGIVDKALQWFGLSSPPPPPRPVPPPVVAPPVPKPDPTIQTSINASALLNSNGHGQSLSMVVRVYRLRDDTAFMQTPASVFGNDTQEKQAFGADLIDVREVVLVPTKQLAFKLIAPAAVSRIGVVGLFRAPAPNRWRLLFDAKAATASGIAVTAHGCQWTIEKGQALDTQTRWTRSDDEACQ